MSYAGLTALDLALGSISRPDGPGWYGNGPLSLETENWNWHLTGGSWVGWWRSVWLMLSGRAGPLLRVALLPMRAFAWLVGICFWPFAVVARRFKKA